MALNISPSDDAVLTAVRALLLAILGDGWEVFQGQGNRVPEPAGDNFVVMTPVHRNRLSTNTVTWDTAAEDPTALAHRHDVEIQFQLDIHGPLGADAATTIAMLLRDDWAVPQLAPAGVAPLYATDGNQLPFINGEHQYENRWVMTAAFQIVPTVSTPAEFTASLDATIFPPFGGRFP